jgi:hypothetical protein
MSKSKNDENKENKNDMISRPHMNCEGERKWKAEIA